jgi:cytochrome P450
MLRYDSPVQGMFRFVTQDVELSGKRIPARSMVMPLMGSANRDPRRYEEPERFDVTRAQAQSISFGHGIHFCLGAPLSRLEARVVFEELLPRLRHLSFASDQPQEIDWAENVVLRGPKQLRLAVELAPQRP